MEELTAKLQQLGINKTPSTDQIVNLITQHESRKLREKQRAATKPPNYEQTAKMQWAKDHIELVNQHKLELGAKPETKTKIVKGNVVSKIKYILPTNKQYEYSVWLAGEVNTDPNYSNYYLPLAQEQLNSTRNINAFVDFLQHKILPDI